MENRDKIIEILKVIRHTTTDIEKQADRILLLFNVSKRSSCCNATIDTDEQSCEICSNCGDRIE